MATLGSLLFNGAKHFDIQVQHITEGKIAVITLSLNIHMKTYIAI